MLQKSLQKVVNILLGQPVESDQNSEQNVQGDMVYVFYKYVWVSYFICYIIWK